MTMEQTKSYHRALTIAGSDSGGGAGIQADLKTFSALGCYGMSVLTALTAQNTKKVVAIFEVDPTFVDQQINAVLDDLGADAIKIGMLHDPRVIEIVAENIKKRSISNVVLDPVMVAQSGDKLIKNEAIKALTEQLFPLSRIITPNLPEAEELLNRDINGADQMEQAARDLLEWGPESVLLKGGHGSEQKSRDCLVQRQSPDEEVSIEWMEAEYIETNNTHGTGCTLSSAIAAYLARGGTLQQAVASAKHYITGAIHAGSTYKIGEGSGPLHHFYQFWNGHTLNNQ